MSFLILSVLPLTVHERMNMYCTLPALTSPPRHAPTPALSDSSAPGQLSEWHLEL